jgi:hypothetical protein
MDNVGSLTSHNPYRPPQSVTRIALLFCVICVVFNVSFIVCVALCSALCLCVVCYFV